MNSERGSLIRDIVIRLLFVLLFMFLFFWLFPMPNLKPFYDKVFNENIITMKETAKNYFTVDRLPSEVGDTVRISLRDMLDKKLLLNFTDKNGKTCDVDKSYVEVTKTEKEYVLKTFLHCSGNEDYIIEYLGCKDLCKGLSEGTINGTESGNCGGNNNCCCCCCNCDTVAKITEYQYSKPIKDTYWTPWTDWMTEYRDVDNITSQRREKTQVMGRKWSNNEVWRYKFERTIETTVNHDWSTITPPKDAINIQTRTRTIEDGWGAWSAWSISYVSASSTREVRTRQSSIESGWGAWSTWSTSYVSGSSTREVETRQSSSTSGWGAWSAWSTSSVSGSSNREVETRQTSVHTGWTNWSTVPISTKTGHDEYQEVQVQTGNGGTSCAAWKNAGSTSSKTALSSSNTKRYILQNTSSCGTNCTMYFYTIETRSCSTTGPTYETRYNYRDKIYSNVTEYRYRDRTSSNVTEYRYRDRTYSDVTEYSYRDKTYKQITEYKYDTKTYYTEETWSYSSTLNGWKYTGIKELVSSNGGWIYTQWLDKLPDGYELYQKRTIYSYRYLKDTTTYVYKWSKDKNDQKLINEGYKLTGKTREVDDPNGSTNNNGNCNATVTCTVTCNTVK